MLGRQRPHVIEMAERGGLISFLVIGEDVWIVHAQLKGITKSSRNLAKPSVDANRSAMSVDKLATAY